MKKSVAFDYEEQRWVEEEDGAALRVKQLEQELQILRGVKGSEYLRFCGANCTVEQAIAHAELELAALKG